VIERVIPLDLGVTWAPNAPFAVLLVQDDGLAQLVINAHIDDPDQRPVTIRWGGCMAAVMQPPNDEALAGHPLYNKGLSEIIWAGEVLDSKWIARLELQNRVHWHHDQARFARLRHFIVPLKEKTVEAVADTWRVVRSDRVHLRLTIHDFT
jgi:hypothetical protein